MKFTRFADLAAEPIQHAPPGLELGRLHAADDTVDSDPPAQGQDWDWWGDGKSEPIQHAPPGLALGRLTTTDEYVDFDPPAQGGNWWDGDAGREPIQHAPPGLHLDRMHSADYSDPNDGWGWEKEKIADEDVDYDPPEQGGDWWTGDDGSKAFDIIIVWGQKDDPKEDAAAAELTVEDVMALMTVEVREEDAHQEDDTQADFIDF